MRYQAQVRTKTYSGEWTQWVNVGDPMLPAESREWEELQAKVTTGGRVEFRVIPVMVAFEGIFRS